MSGPGLRGYLGRSACIGPGTGNPQRVDVHINLSTALIKDRDWENARKELELAEKLLVESRDYRQARAFKEVRQKLEANQPVDLGVYWHSSTSYWDS